MLQPRQITLVQESFARVVPISAAAAADFYARLFAIAPDTRPLFRNDMDAQGRKLFQTLAAVVDALDALDQVVPVAQALAVRHIGYGARREHYAAVGTALVETLRGALGHRFDAETEAAWADAYAVLSGCMLAAAEHAGPAGGSVCQAPDAPALH